MKKSKNLTLKVYHKIIELMLNYEIVPGQRLVFVDLAKQLNVSRTPVNNALAILAQEGYLDFVPNQGYSVHKMTKKEAEDLFEIREVLEVGFIGQAIRKMTDKGLEKLKQKKIAYENISATHVTRKLFVLDTEFHVAIIDMADNEALSKRYRDLCQKIFLRFRTEDLRMDRIIEIKSEHENIFEAIQMRDVDLTKERLRMHHMVARKSLFPIIFPG
ncbi:GntR family transcriptional regulator [Desulforhopalus singaporensis]|uniref:DNA-binding transcriptional regulator, GntR family n=1 Tax=Desulforhopalus singaporensis TaxID=91360 RepID=A0A1H0IT59_9BACT|nr:GntR family transcriptional regulator [Desulforhopalus singaporensis]SDO34619.1 DNA-binding transcriptional regulator, GntR family [Desulforhopalus singaporensis]